jgi:hypothetical protein
MWIVGGKRIFELKTGNQHVFLVKISNHNYFALKTEPRNMYLTAHNMKQADLNVMDVEIYITLQI